MLRQRLGTVLAAVLLATAGSQPASAAQVPNATFWPVGYQETFLSWSATPDAFGYLAYVNGVPVPVVVSAPQSFIDSGRREVTIDALLGPADVVELAVIDAAGGVGPRIRAAYGASDYLFLPELDVRFAENATAPDATGLSKIVVFSQLLSQHGFTRMIAVGHDAGSVGAPNAYRLGQLRARAVATAVGRLVSVATVTSSWGNSSPIESNATALGRAVNRRVELGLR